MNFAPEHCCVFALATCNSSFDIIHHNANISSFKPSIFLDIDFRYSFSFKFLLFQISRLLGWTTFNTEDFAVFYPFGVGSFKVLLATKNFRICRGSNVSRLRVLWQNFFQDMLYALFVLWRTELFWWLMVSSFIPTEALVLLIITMILSYIRKTSPATQLGSPNVSSEGKSQDYREYYSRDQCFLC